MPVGAIIGAAGAIGGALIGSSSQKSAAKSAAQTADRTAQMNNALTRDIYNQNKQTLAPYVGAGAPATTNLNALLGLGTEAQRGEAQNDFRNFMQSSDYGFQFGEGANALNSGFAARGAIQSGAAMKGLERFRQNLQDGYRGQYMNLLGNQQGVGLSAASAQAGVGQNYVNSITANNNSAGTAAANAALMRGNANAQMWSGIGNALGGLAGNAFGSSYGGF